MRRAGGLRVEEGARIVLAAMLVAVAAVASGQPIAGSPGGPGSTDTRQPEAAGAVDVHTIDPHSFRAMAARLPDGAAPQIDGRLDDEVWSAAPVFSNFIQREPIVGAPSTERTEFRVLYDDAKLYFAIWAYEPHPGGIVASEMLRDSPLRKGDAVRIVLDTFHDHRNSFYFSTNPLGAQKDGYATENGRMNWDWNAIWEVKTTRDDDGWYSEFAIPLSQIRYRDGAAEQVWGFNVGRIIIHKREETHFVPYPREWQGPGIYRISGAGLLGGLEGLERRRRLELVPFVAPDVSRNYDVGTPTAWNRGFGFDLRVGVSEGLNADLTYRTDFAQVEADQEVVNLTRFSLFFPEKRQFFTESAGVFSYGRVGDEGGATGGRGSGPGLLSLFYSRTIGLSEDGRAIPIVAGGRVAGTAGPYTIGLMNIETDSAAYPGANGVVQVPRANYTVARLKRNVLKSSTIGVIALNREGLVGANAFNRSVGIDGNFSIGNSLTMIGLLAKTVSPGVTSRDMAGALNVDWATDRYTAAAGYTDIQEAFNAEMGFVPRTDIRNATASASWTPRPDWPGVRQLTFLAASEYFENHEGSPQSRLHEASFTLTRNDRSTFRTSLLSEFDRLSEPFRVGPDLIPVGAYSWETFSANYSSDDSRRVFGGGGVDLGGYYNGDKRTLRLALNFLPRETLLVENNYTRNNISLPAAPTYVTNTLNTRISYSLSPTLFLKAFVQYNDDRKLANLNLMLWSIYRPGSDLYVVYNQGWETNLPGPQQLRVRNRQLSLKVTYWLSR